MNSKIKINDKVLYNNLPCYVVGIEKMNMNTYLELRPVGSSATFSTSIDTVTKIMNEGTRNYNLSNILYD